jgi:hypothetical protein
MFTPLLVLMLSSAGDSVDTFSLKPAAPARCSGACAEQYRLPFSSDEGDSKARALSDTGVKCNVVGAQRCLSKRRVMWRSNGDSPIAEVAAKLGLR